MVRFGYLYLPGALQGSYGAPGGDAPDRHGSITGQPSVYRSMVGTAVGLTVAVVLILLGLWIAAIASAWLPDDRPPE